MGTTVGPTSGGTWALASAILTGEWAGLGLWLSDSRMDTTVGPTSGGTWAVARAILTGERAGLGLWLSILRMDTTVGPTSGGTWAIARAILTDEWAGLGLWLSESRMTRRARMNTDRGLACHVAWDWHSVSPQHPVAYPVTIRDFPCNQCHP